MFAAMRKTSPQFPCRFTLDAMEEAMIQVEKRRHLRIDDRLMFSWRPVDEEHLEVEDTREAMRTSVNREIHQLITALSETSPEVVKVLLQLNHKLDLIADHNNESLYGPSLISLNVSQSGVAFEWHDPIAEGLLVQLTLTIPPDNFRLHLIATVVECIQRESDSTFVVRCILPSDQPRELGLLKDYIEYILLMQEDENRLIAPDSDDIAADSMQSGR